MLSPLFVGCLYRLNLTAWSVFHLVNSHIVAISSREVYLAAKPTTLVQIDDYRLMSCASYYGNRGMG